MTSTARRFSTRLQALPALGVLLALGPRIGKFAPDGKPREIPAHNPWLVTIGIFMIYVGFFGFYAACHIPIVNIAAEGAPPTGPRPTSTACRSRSRASR